MKKSIHYSLLIAALLFAGIVYAQVDITPSRYVFSALEVGSYALDKGYNGANPPANDPDVVDNWNNGFIGVGNPNIAVGPDFADGQGKILNSYYQILDMGGEVGKVLCAKGSESTFPYGVAGDEGFWLGWWNQFIFTDPAMTPNVKQFLDAGDTEEVATAKATVRFKVVFHIHQNEISTTNKLFDILGYTYSGDHKKVNEVLTATQEFKSGDFTDLEFNEETEQEEITYNPNKWIACEYDFVAKEEAGAPLRFTMRMGGNYKSTTLLIKSIEMTVNPTGEAVEREELTLTSNPETSAIREVTEKGALDYFISDRNLTLKQVKIGANVAIYSISGQMLHSAVANSTEVTIPLAEGFYVVKAGAKTAKVIVK